MISQSLYAAFNLHPDSLMGQTGILLSYQTEEGVVVVRRRDFYYHSHIFLLKRLTQGHDPVFDEIDLDYLISQADWPLI